MRAPNLFCICESFYYEPSDVNYVIVFLYPLSGKKITSVLKGQYLARSLHIERTILDFTFRYYNAISKKEDFAVSL